MIKLNVVGHLGKDAVVSTVNGRNVINFTVAHSERFKDAQGVQKERTIWVDCGYWTDKTAIAPYLKKGTLVSPRKLFCKDCGKKASQYDHFKGYEKKVTTSPQPLVSYQPRPSSSLAVGMFHS